MPPEKMQLVFEQAQLFAREWVELRAIVRNKLCGQKVSRPLEVMSLCTPFHVSLYTMESTGHRQCFVKGFLKESCLVRVRVLLSTAVHLPFGIHSLSLSVCLKDTISYYCVLVSIVMKALVPMCCCMKGVGDILH